ncbi:MAG: PAS domain S-box protein [Bacteroidales bacterium]|nr:PAS domain S-box protein [Bacteroidales bacterium]MBK9357069.1 PAS domain S-box protein [Bacteroidales bacterium]
MIKLLYIEDDLVDQMAFKRLIRENSLPYEMTLANSVKSALEKFSEGTFDIVISDFLLGDGTSFEYLPEMIRTGIPVILVTGTGDEDVAVKAIKMGASDYVIKDVDFGHLKMLPLIVDSSLHNKRSDEKLKKLSMAVEQSPSMLLITGKEGFIEYINPRVTEITGYVLSDFSGTNLFNHHLTHNSEDTVNDISETIARGKKWQGNTCHAKKSGELFWELTTISPIYDNDGHLTGFIKVAEDITEKKKAEEAIKKYSEELRESNASKDKMFSIIAHDLRTPFNGLLAFSDILSNDYESLSKDEVQEYIEVIRSLSRNTFNLLEKLLQWSRLQTGRMEFNPVNLDFQDQVEPILNLLSANARGKSIELTGNIEKGLTISGDQNMIHAVIRNLTSNAIKFTPENGSVEITARSIPGNLAEIAVSDTGIGIDPCNIKKLFRVETQHSTKGTRGETGTGLGLILCKEFIERNGGSIRVESEPGKGSRFIFTLPLAG